MTNEPNDGTLVGQFLAITSNDPEDFTEYLRQRGSCVSCGLRDATPGRADGLCSECAADLDPAPRHQTAADARAISAAAGRFGFGGSGKPWGS